MINVLQGYVVNGPAVGVADRNHGVITLSERQIVLRLSGSTCNQTRPALHRVSIRGKLGDVDLSGLSNVVQIDSIGPVGAAVDRSVAVMWGYKECVIAVADLEVKAFADRHAVGVDRRDRDRIVAQVGGRRDARDEAGMGIEAEAAGQRP